MRARRDELSSNQNVAVTNNLAEVGGSYVPLLAAWCAQLLPEIADEEEVRVAVNGSVRALHDGLGVL